MLLLQPLFPFRRFEYLHQDIDDFFNQIKLIYKIHFFFFLPGIGSYLTMYNYLWQRFQNLNPL